MTTNAAPRLETMTRLHRLPTAIIRQYGQTIEMPDAAPASQPMGEEVRPAETGETAWDRFIHRRLREGSENLYDEWTAMTERQLLSHVLDHTAATSRTPPASWASAAARSAVSCTRSVSMIRSGRMNLSRMRCNQRR